MAGKDTAAFPRSGKATQTGMALRDYFAAKALLGMLSGPAGAQIVNNPDEQAMLATSLAAYAIADTMLQARAA